MTLDSISGSQVPVDSEDGSRRRRRGVPAIAPVPISSIIDQDEETIIPSGNCTYGGRWSLDEEQSLRRGIEEIGTKNWRRISEEYLNGKRTDVQCMHRWQKVIKCGLKKGPWSPEEDQEIIRCMSEGISSWSEIASRISGRIGKQCRERYYNHLDPNINKDPWTPEEDAVLLREQARLGNRWSEIAHYLPGRSENAVKNRWNSSVRRRVMMKASDIVPDISLTEVPKQSHRRTKVKTVLDVKDIDHDTDEGYVAHGKSSVSVFPPLGEAMVVNAAHTRRTRQSSDASHRAVSSSISSVTSGERGSGSHAKSQMYGYSKFEPLPTITPATVMSNSASVSNTSNGVLPSTTSQAHNHRTRSTTVTGVTVVTSTPTAPAPTGTPSSLTFPAPTSNFGQQKEAQLPSITSFPVPSNIMSSPEINDYPLFPIPNNGGVFPSGSPFESMAYALGLSMGDSHDSDQILGRSGTPISERRVNVVLSPENVRRFSRALLASQTATSDPYGLSGGDQFQFDDSMSGSLSAKGITAKHLADCLGENIIPPESHDLCGSSAGPGGDSGGVERAGFNSAIILDELLLEETSDVETDGPIPGKRSSHMHIVPSGECVRDNVDIVDSVDGDELLGVSGEAVLSPFRSPQRLAAMGLSLHSASGTLSVPRASRSQLPHSLALSGNMQGTGGGELGASSDSVGRFFPGGLSSPIRSSKENAEIGVNIGLSVSLSGSFSKFDPAQLLQQQLEQALPGPQYPSNSSVSGSSSSESPSENSGFVTRPPSIVNLNLDGNPISTPTHNHASTQIENRLLTKHALSGGSNSGGSPSPSAQGRQKRMCMSNRLSVARVASSQPPAASVVPDLSKDLDGMEEQKEMEQKETPLSAPPRRLPSELSLPTDSFALFPAQSGFLAAVQNVDQDDNLSVTFSHLSFDLDKDPDLSSAIASLQQSLGTAPQLQASSNANLAGSAYKRVGGLEISPGSTTWSLASSPFRTASVSNPGSAARLPLAASSNGGIVNSAGRATPVPSVSKSGFSEEGLAQSLSPRRLSRLKT